MKEFEDLVSLMDRLRAECPWDREQNLASLRKYLLEESYECLEALQNYIDQPKEENYQHLKEELGDVLLQILFQSKILAELTQRPALQELQKELSEKLIRRHPHIFADARVNGADAVLQQWNEIKKTEKKPRESLLSDIPSSLPALLRAQKIGERSTRVDFDWKNAEEVWPQLQSELRELEQADSAPEREMEFGDVLFTMIQWARHQGIDPEVALQGSNQKFVQRFEWMEKRMKEENKNLKDLSMKEKEDLWANAKKSLQKI